MKTRNQAKRPPQPQPTTTTGSLVNTSNEGVSKFLNKVGSRGSKKRDGYIRKCDYATKGMEKQVNIDIDARKVLGVEGSSGNNRVENASPLKPDDGNPQQAKSELEDEMADSDWEDGSNPNVKYENDHLNKDITIEFDSAPGTAKRKPVRRASAEEKEVAELVHRTHLLCLLGRGRLIDSACDDSLIQASIMSLLPANLLELSEVTNLTSKALAPLVNWLHGNFRVRSSSIERSFHSALTGALANQEGTPEEVAALSVAAFRALNLSTRFVSILDAASLKPDGDKSDDAPLGRKTGKGLFDSSTVMVTRPNEASVSSGQQSAPADVKNITLTDQKNASEASAKASCRRKIKKSGQSISQDHPNERKVDLPSSDTGISGTSEGLKRKGDIEFELQMEMALAATAAGTSDVNVETNVNSLNITSSSISPFKKLKKVEGEDSTGISTAVGLRKIGAPMYWAEVFCSGENSTGKWVHVDVVNAIIDGEQKVEAAAAACKTSLRYVIAFAGRGAKDVTRRYCAKWYKIASHRVDSTWWDAVLRPLKELESGATGGNSKLSDKSSASGVRDNSNRNSLEDMELETKALTEPLPTNQQAYRSHHLYALERWLTKYQILHPKGPVLGFCSGHPVYPRACVQMLHTKERWLREGLQLKVNELPVKVLQRPVKLNKGKLPGADEDDENDCVGPGGTIDLYGKWQTEPLCLPRAENGIVPKNERGQVDVWSEKCLPPGTVHLGFPRIFAIAKKLGIDYAPAMVGFEFRSGRSFPLYNGIVVCTEFRDTILEAYAEEEERRGAEERRKNEAQALSRWYQLLSSIVTRQRLNNRYAEGVSSNPLNEIQKTDDKFHNHTSTITGMIIQKPISQQVNEDASQPDTVAQSIEEDHEHVFMTNDQSFDVGSSVRTKWCHCGFSIEVEEL
uniref:DNA repair protein RAD4 n=1 Tax=Erigeron canadensis TaxID=72917 RepID=UPI001CB8C36F|nr:DNA repair protein RAD4 [Erigeron canadensis]